MNNFIVIPDSFKGTLSSSEICEIMRKSILKAYPNAEILSIPVADGGEGSVDCFLQALGGEKVHVPVSGPFFETMEGFYGLINNGSTAVIEMAACAGLPLVENRKDPCAATTYGVGQLILDAAKRGVKTIILGLGGSATNDGGCGAASAAGFRFYNQEGNEFVPTGGTLVDIARIDASQKDASLKDLQIIAMCDIDNPMYGKTGAAAVFGPQKGADEEMVAFLDKGLRHLSKMIQNDLGKDVSTLPGGGAAGAMGAGMAAFFDSQLQMGIQTVLDVVHFDEAVQGTDLVLTGEGKIDFQSLRGKVVIGVAQRAKQYHVPVAAIVGDIGDNIEQAYEMGVSGIFSINRVAVDFSKAKLRAAQDMALTVENLLQFTKTIQQTN